MTENPKENIRVKLSVATMVCLWLIFSVQVLILMAIAQLAQR